jgi:hypothetical protein
MGGLVAAITAGIVTYLEVDQVFSIPAGSPGRWGTRAIIGAFVVLNGILAFGLYALLNHASALSGVEEWLAGLLVGAGYLSLVRLKFATVNDQPFGFEFFYDQARDFAYSRINRRVIESRKEAAEKRADGASLANLIEDANMQVQLDSLLSAEGQVEVKAWILEVVKSPATEKEKKILIADFLCSGSRTRPQPSE